MSSTFMIIIKCCKSWNFSWRELSCKELGWIESTYWGQLIDTHLHSALPHQSGLIHSANYIAIIPFPVFSYRNNIGIERGFGLSWLGAALSGPAPLKSSLANVEPSSQAEETIPTTELGLLPVSHVLLLILRVLLSLWLFSFPLRFISLWQEKAK